MNEQCTDKECDMRADGGYGCLIADPRGEKCYKPLIEKKDDRAEVLCSVGLEGPMVKLGEVIKLISEYCVLDIDPEDEEEDGFHNAGTGIIKALKDKYLKAA